MKKIQNIGFKITEKQKQNLQIQLMKLQEKNELHKYYQQQKLRKRKKKKNKKLRQEPEDESCIKYLEPNEFGVQLRETVCPLPTSVESYSFCN